MLLQGLLLREHVFLQVCVGNPDWAGDVSIADFQVLIFQQHIYCGRAGSLFRNTRTKFSKIQVMVKEAQNTLPLWLSDLWYHCFAAVNSNQNVINVDNIAPKELSSALSAETQSIWKMFFKSGAIRFLHQEEAYWKEVNNRISERITSNNCKAIDWILVWKVLQKY